MVWDLWLMWSGCLHVGGSGEKECLFWVCVHVCMCVCVTKISKDKQVVRWLLWSFFNFRSALFVLLTRAPLIKVTLNQISFNILWILLCGKMSIPISLDLFQILCVITHACQCQAICLDAPLCVRYRIPFKPKHFVCLCLSLFSLFQVWVSPKLILQLAWSRYSGEIMERAPPIDVQLARLPGPEERGTLAVVILTNRRLGWGL